MIFRNQVNNCMKFMYVDYFCYIVIWSRACVISLVGDLLLIVNIVVLLLYCCIFNIVT